MSDKVKNFFVYNNSNEFPGINNGMLKRYPSPHPNVRCEATSKADAARLFHISMIFKTGKFL